MEISYAAIIEASCFNTQSCTSRLILAMWFWPKFIRTDRSRDNSANRILAPFRSSGTVYRLAICKNITSKHIEQWCDDQLLLNRICNVQIQTIPQTLRSFTGVIQGWRKRSAYQKLATHLTVKILRKMYHWGNAMYTWKTSLNPWELCFKRWSNRQGYILTTDGNESTLLLNVWPTTR